MEDLNQDDFPFVEDAMPEAEALASADDAAVDTRAALAGQLPGVSHGNE
ncbi:hypothetical protein [Cupriavidus pauculus]